MATNPESASPKEPRDQQQDSVVRAKRLGDAWFGGGLVSGIFAIVSALAAGLSGIWAREADRALERYKAERQEQLMIYERIEKQLGGGTPAGLVIAASYVSLIKDAQIKKGLCETIGAVAASELEAAAEEKRKAQLKAALLDVSRMMRDCSIKVAEANAIAAAAPEQGAISAEQVQTSVAKEAPVVEEMRGYAVNPKGWDIDVFACQSQGEKSAALARRTADWLGKQAQVAGTPIGRVRLRSVSRSAEGQLAPAAGNPVVGTEDEQSFATQIAAQLNANVRNPDGSTASFFYSRTNMVTAWYVSVFTCGFAK